MKKFNVLVEENAHFSELYVRHFPREFANSMVNPASVSQWPFENYERVGTEKPG